MSGAAPTIDGNISENNPREWQEAYNRRIVLTDDNEPLSNDTATLLLMNDDNYLYVALAYDWNNVGNNNQVSFYFDEGAAGGSHDDMLSAGHENGAVFRIGTDISRQDLYWNGTAWAADGDAANDFNSGWAFSAVINNIEMRIPLNNAKTDNATNSDLDVSATDEIGFFFKIYKQGMAGAGMVYWDRFPGTSENVAANYADIQLGVQRTYSTFYASYRALPAAPSLTNPITGDDGWRGCYRRDIVLTNFMGSILKGTLYLVDDVSTQRVYAGIKIKDEQNALDYIRLYQEQNTSTNNTYDALLDTDRENCLQLTAAGVFNDKYFLTPGANDAPGTWPDDPEAADGNAGNASYNATNAEHEFEIRIDRNAGTYDLTLNPNANCQFLIEYFDNDAPAGEGLFYWSNATNNVQVTADQVLPVSRVAIGWGVLQLGAPYCQVISPEDNSNVEGVVHLRVYAEKSGGATADSVRFYRTTASGTKYSMTRIASTFEWTGTYDVTSLATNTKDTLVFQIFDGALTMERLVVVNVLNGSGSVEYPSVSISSPAAGSMASGLITITFSASIGGGFAITSREISIDGGGFVSTTTATTHSWNTTPLADGSHTVQIRATGSNGMSAASSLITYIIKNSPSVSITAPAPDSTARDTVDIAFTATPVAPATIASTWISVDGGSYAATATSATHRLATGPLADGAHTIKIKAIDSNGKEAVSEIIKINTSNSPAVSILSPVADATVSGTIIVSFTATAISSASISSAQISIDGGGWTSTTTAATHTLDTRGLSEGAHLIQVRATDSNGKTGTSQILKVSVTNVPAVTVSAPKADSVVSGTLVVMFAATPVAPATIAATQISVDGAAFRATSTAATDTLDTRGLTDGDHILQIKTVDSSNKTALSQIIKFVVRNAPSVTLTAPRADSVVSGTLVVLFAATPVAPATIASTQISVDGGAWRATSTGSNDTLNTQPLTDGSHTVQVRVTDSSGKIGYSQTIKFNVQNLPAVTITVPRADSVVSGTLVVLFTATPVAPATITSTQISVDGGAWRATSTGSTDTLNTQPLTEGSHTIQVRATDSNNKSGLSQVIKIVVRNNPSVAITVPRADSVVSGTLVVLFTATPVAPATIAATQISVDGAAFRATSTGSTDTLDTRGLTDGDHIVQIKAIDSNSKTAVSQIIKFVVRNAPSVTLWAPRADSVVAGTIIVRFTASAVAPSVITKREIFIDGAFLDTSTTDSTYSWNTLVLTDGTHSVQVRVTDSNGKTAESARILVKVFNTPVVAITAPAETLTLFGVDTVKYNATYAPGAQRDTTEISFDGGAWIPTTAALSHVWTTTDFADNSHTVQVRATGTNGKTGYSQILHYRVNNSPRAAIVEPVAGETVSGMDTVRFTSSAVAPSVLIRRELSIDGGTFSDTLVDSASRVISTIDLADGTHSVQVRVTDDHGRTGYSQQVLFITRNAPSVTVALPEPGDTLSDSILVRFTATPVAPATIDSTLISVDGSRYAPTLDDSTAIIDSRTLADGSHIFIIKVVDNKRKTGQSEPRLFVVDNASPVLAAPKVVYPAEALSAKSGAQVLVTVAVKDVIAGLALDSAVVLTSQAIGASPVTLVMQDNGSGGDAVSNDNIYTAAVDVGTDSTGSIPYTITATDRLGNVSTLTSAIILDNIRPITGFTLHSTDDTSLVAAADTLFREAVILKGSYSDRGGSLLSRVFVSVINDTGRHVGNSPVVLSPKDSLLSLIVPLNVGGNTIMLFAEDRAGNKDSTVVRIVNIDRFAPNAAYALSPLPELVGTPAVKAVYVDKLVMKGTYSDAGGSGLTRVHMTVINDSALHVNNSPVDLSVKDSVFSRVIALVPGENIISLTAVDHAGNSVLVTDTIICLEPKQTGLVGKAGGTLQSPDGASVNIPENALLSTIEITITKVDPVEERKPLDTTLTLLNVAHDFGPNGTVFRKPVTIILPYTDIDLDRDQNGVTDIEPLKLSLVFWDGSTWRAVGGSVVDTAARRVTAQVNHFTIYDLAQCIEPVPSKLKAYWTHNPIRYSEGSTFVFELSEPGTVGLAVYDVSGNLVTQIIKNKSPFGAGVHDGRFVWRGENVSGRFAGAGLYVYAFTFTSETGKKTIIRKPLGLVR